MVSQEFRKHPAYCYAVDVVNGKEIAGEYVKLQCQRFLDDIEDEDSPYFVNEKMVKRVTDLTKLINMSTGFRRGISCYEALVGFQWFFIINILCIFHKDIPEKRRYEKSVLLIARKNGKSFLVGLIVILLMLLEAEFSEFYTVAPDRELSGIVKKEVQQMIESSPKIQKYFKPLRSEIRCTLKKSKFMPLACSDNRLDGRLPTAYVADEVGALKNRYPISAMESGQLNLVNKTGILISTAYESLENPMTEEVEACQKALKGLTDHPDWFALLYMPDNPKEWMSDEALLQANPLMQHLEQNLIDLKKKRQVALEMPSETTNFKTKHLNIFVDGNELEQYISLDDLREGKIEPNSYDWNGKEVWIGVDLSQTNDNTAISMLTYDKSLEKYVAKSWVFYPADREEEKIQREDVKYDQYKRLGLCYACGGRVIDYKFVEDFLLSIEERYKVKIMSITYDKYNALSSVQKWEDAGYEMREQPQFSKDLHLGTKRFREVVLDRKFLYEDNRLFEINIQNAKLDHDTNRNMYINKKKSSGKIDIVDALINCFCTAVIDGIETKSVYEDRGFIFW